MTAQQRKIIKHLAAHSGCTFQGLMSLMLKAEGDRVAVDLEELIARRYITAMQFTFPGSTRVEFLFRVDYQGLRRVARPQLKLFDDSVLFKDI